TSTIRRGSAHCAWYFAAVISSFVPFICIAPSPTRATATRLEVARVPVGRGAGVRRHDRVRGQVAVQLPEEALRGDRARVLERTFLEQPPPALDLALDLLAPRAVLLALEQRDQHLERRLRIADEPDVHRIAHVQHPPVG